MTGDLRLPSPVQEITDPGPGHETFQLILKRDDLISPDFPGNKWRKLAPNLEAARRGGHRTLLTFGGAYSNHVRATATVQALQEEAFGGRRGDWRIDDEFHFGGFARHQPELDRFIDGFRDRHGLSLDRVYVAKMMYGIYAHAARGTFAPGRTVVAVITG